MPQARSLFVTVLLLAACGGADEGDSVPPVSAPGSSASGGEAASGESSSDAASSDSGTWVNRYDAILGDMLAVLQGVTDASSAEAAVADMEALGERLASLRAEAEREGGAGLVGQAMADPAAWQAGGSGLGQTQGQLTEEFMRLAMDPAMRPHLDDLTEAMGDAMEGR